MIILPVELNTGQRAILEIDKNPWLHIKGAGKETIEKILSDDKLKSSILKDVNRAVKMANDTLKDEIWKLRELRDLVNSLKNSGEWEEWPEWIINLANIPEINRKLNRGDFVKILYARKAVRNIKRKAFEILEFKK